jgi:nucleoside-diphosphate-sugar epimerase
MNIIVTGGAGFLGHHLCRALSKAGHTVTVIDVEKNEEFDTHIADVRDLEAMKQHITSEVDVVFHLASLIEAGESVKEPQKYVDHNITGTVSVLEAMRLNGVKTFIFSSSAAIYGEPERVPIFEDDRTLPINPYGMTKLAMEGLLRSYVESFEFTGVALRYFNLYGPGENHEPETHAIPRFIKQIYEGTEVTVWGSGEHLRDFIYIDDVVNAHLTSLNLVAAKPNQYHYLNISTQQPQSVADVINMIESKIGKKAAVKNFPNRPGDPLVLVADASKANVEMNWKAQVSLSDGLDKTVDYFLKKWQG